MEERKLDRFNRIMKLLLPLVAVVVAVIMFFDMSATENDGRGFQNNQGLVFGTTYSIIYSNADTVDLLPHIKNAFNAIDESLSMFNNNSVISRVNANDSTVMLDELFLKVFVQGKDIYANTEGAFDMTVAPLVDLWGFGVEERGDIDSSEVMEVMELIGFDKIELEEGKRVVKGNAKMRMDASAIAKGFACDVVADTLKAYGCENYCVEIGGEVVVGGINPDGNKWRIGINKPIQDSLSMVNEIQHIVEFTDGAMATSGNYRNFYVDGKGRMISHTINPKTGFPVEHSLLSATIIADDCLTADALATACMVLGVEQSKKMLEKYPQVRYYFVYVDEKEELKIEENL